MREHLAPEVVADLRRMWRTARTVNGSTPADDPRRRVGADLAAAMAALVDQGFTTYRIAKDLGISEMTVRFRLGRYGYMPLPQSQTKAAARRRRDGGCGRCGSPWSTDRRGRRYCHPCRSGDARRIRAATGRFEAVTADA